MDQHGFQIRHLVHSRRKVLVKIRDADPAVPHLGLLLESHSQPPHQVAFHLRFHGPGIDDQPAILGAHHPLDPDGFLLLVQGHLGHHGHMGLVLVDSTGQSTASEQAGGPLGQGTAPVRLVRHRFQHAGQPPAPIPNAGVRATVRAPGIEMP